MTRSKRVREYERQVDRFVRYAKAVERLALLRCADDDFSSRCDDVMDRMYCDTARNCAVVGVWLSDRRGRSH